MILGFDFDCEKTPCIFAHSEIKNLFYSKDSPLGFTQDISVATRFIGSKERMEGLDEVLRKYPSANRKCIIFQYI